MVASVMEASIFSIKYFFPLLVGDKQISSGTMEDLK